MVLSFPLSAFVAMQFKDEKEERIIRESTAIFKRFGIKSVNMDDLATQLGVSKKTLYKYVSDKDELVHRVFEFHALQEDCEIQQITERNLNAIDESYEIMRMVLNMVRDLHPSVLYDMKKYHPEIMHKMQCTRDDIIATTLRKNMEKGVQEGYYRDDIRPDFIASLYVSAVESIIEQLAGNESTASFKDLYLELFRYHIRGIASEKGIAYLIEKVNQERQTKQ
jgi:AcrR family transcriptional regulator